MSKSARFLLSLLAFLTLLGCDSDQRLFEELTAEATGIDFRNQIEESNDFNILDYLYFYNGGGVAVGDINNDGLVDVFFSGNQAQNKLYLNLGDMKFQDITERAGIKQISDWNTGAVMGDINGDGYLDIYVCAVVGLKGLTGHNALYINNGDQTFSERSAEYKLDFDTYSSSAAFLDYDLDGDLDIYLLNHAIHTPESFGNASLRYTRNYETGDKLLRNDSLYFTDVSEDAGIFGGVNSYGLGVAISDFNVDGYPDIFIGNDFHEDDYFYINNADGTFSHMLNEYFGQTSRFSMGNDVADINNDGYPDLISLDMLPEDERVLKMSEGDEDINTLRLRQSAYGYYYQFSRNMLNIGQQNGQFVETAIFSGVEATDWSWSALFADFNLDGRKDLFISNGIPKRPNDLDFIKFVSNDQIRNTIDVTKIVDQQALELMPDGAANNMLFKGGDNLQFEDMSETWKDARLTYTTSSAIADLDNDGDLDIVSNHLNAEATVLVNISLENNYLKVKLQYPFQNSFGIGSRVVVFTKAGMQTAEFYTARGFQSSSEPSIHFGLGDSPKVDSIQVVWPNGKIQTQYEVEAGTLTIAYNPDKREGSDDKEQKLFSATTLLSFEHEEDRYVHFDRQKLIPFQASDRGPGVAVLDFNGDGKEDVLFGSSKFKEPKVYVQRDTGFVHQILGFEAGLARYETVDVESGDFDGNGTMDLLLANGGSDFFGNAVPLTDIYLTNKESAYIESTFPDYFTNSSVVATADYDNDGDLDVFIGSHGYTGDYGRIPPSYLLNNSEGAFSPVELGELATLGLVTDAIWTDFNSDGFQDLIVVGEWMNPTFLQGDGNTFKKWESGVSARGLWQSVYPFDIDKDGDLDYMLGNWGLNSKYEASKENPLKMYYADFDQNGSTETIVSLKKAGGYYPIESFDELAGQMVGLRKEYTQYAQFAGKSVEEVFGVALSDAQVFEVEELRSGYLLNDDGTFTFYAFESPFQLAPITAFQQMDVDSIKGEELIVAGNYFGVKPFMGRLGSFPGAVMWDPKTYRMGTEIGLDFLYKAMVDLTVIQVEGQPHLLATANNDKAVIYRLNPTK